MGKTGQRLTDETKTMIAQLAGEGMTSAQIHAIVGGSIESVYRWAPDAPRRRSPRAPSAKEQKDAVRLYAEGMSLQKIAEKIYAPSTVVKAALKAAGIELRPKNTHGASMNAKAKAARLSAMGDKIRKMHAAGKSDKQIAYKLGLSWSTVSAYRKELGLAIGGSRFEVLSKEIVRMRGEGATYRKIAAVLKIPIGTIPHYMQRLNLDPGRQTSRELSTITSIGLESGLGTDSTDVEFWKRMLANG